MLRLWALVETTLRRRPWVVTLLALIPCAYFDAAALNYMVASKVLRVDVGALVRPGATVSPADSEQMSRGPGAHHVRDTARILTRNIFDSDAGCLTCAPPDAAAEEPTATPGQPAAAMDTTLRTPDNSPPCDGTLRVTGAVQAEDPLWSFVFLAGAGGGGGGGGGFSPYGGGGGGGGGGTLPYRVGAEVESKRVASIGWHGRFGAYVMLRTAATGPYCFYAQTMPPRQAAAAPPPPTPAAMPAPEGNSSLQAAIESGITRDGANAFSIRRNLVEQVLENQAELMRTTRIMPHEQGGRIVGVQLFGVRANSLLGRLGLQNGDVLNRINGLEIASPDRALEAYSRLRTADRLTVSVTRNGQPVNIDFNIR